MTSITILTKDKISMIVDGFKRAGLLKPSSIFENYLLEQDNYERIIWIAYLSGEFVGYITLKWKSLYKPFLDNDIPEINDFNVLPKYRGKGIGLELLKTSENMALTRGNIIGIGVGLYGDYGAAQKLYVKQGYVPDGLGVTYNYERIRAGENVQLDDDLVLWFIKRL